MNIFRPQIPYVFRPPKYSPWFRPILHCLTSVYLTKYFRVRSIKTSGEEKLVKLVKAGQSVLVTPNHADHADPSLLIQIARRHGIAFHFMAAREGFERSRLHSWLLQHSGAFSVDREGADLSAIKTAIQILHGCQYPLVIFPEGEIYHHHEMLDELNEGVATILLRASQKIPSGKQSYAVPVVIRITHDESIAKTFSPRLDRLEQRITWKPRPHMGPVERIYRLGNALLAIKEEEFLGATQSGGLVQRIQSLQNKLIAQVEQKHGLAEPGKGIPSRIKTLRNIIRKELTDPRRPLIKEREAELYDELDRVFAAQQLYSYPGQYLRRNPSIDRIAETLFKLEEDVLELTEYPAPRDAELIFDEPVHVQSFLSERSLNPKTAVQPLTAHLGDRIRELLRGANAG